MGGYFTAPQVGWGPGAIEQLSGLGARRALVVVDPILAKRGAERRIVEELGKSDTAVEVSTDVVVEPTVASLEPGIDTARRHRPDWIVALGGGSTIDTAKGIWVRYAQPALELRAVTPLVELSLRTAARFVAIPTTSGSGSEATWVTHLRDSDGRLLEAGARELMPDWALLDPAYGESLPASTAAEAAADLLAHALEAIASEWANPLSNALAREAIGLAVPALPRALRPAADPEAREHLQFAATMAGVAAANSQLGVAHALAHALGGVAAVPHARIVAAILPYVIEFNYPSARERYMALAPVLGAAAVQNRSALTERLRALWGAAGLPLTLEKAGISRDVVVAERARILEWARAGSSFVSNPRIPSSEELGRLLDVALSGGAVAF
ncbi:MAG TPA: iron-containing alcohol dehydrogenase [Thermoplasmata archaeon]|nr:iron-containing alcohol dehydrogenase [Thermoplasmata archaeon]